MEIGELGVGAAVNLVWGGGTVGTNIYTTRETFGTIPAGALTRRQMVSGKTAIKATFDLDTNTDDLLIGAALYPNIPFDPNVNFDAIRFECDALNTLKFLDKSIANVKVKVTLIP